MGPTAQRTSGIWRGARRAARAVADVVRECDYAQRRLFELRMFGRDHDRAPETYGDFLFRSPTALWHEPSAGRRAAGSYPSE
jgi:hypothetical protein